MRNLIIFLDMDGVLVDFVTGCLKIHNRPEKHDDIKDWNFYKHWGMSDKDFWSKFSTPGFWYNLELYPWAKDFYESLKKYGEVVISTSPSSDPLCVQEKISFCKDKLGVPSSNIMVGSRKELLAAPDRFLIDDYTVNIDKFRNNKGVGLLFEQPWNNSIMNHEGCLEFIRQYKELEL